MSKMIDITGQRFGSLVALEKDNSKHSSNTYWWFQCDCGKKVSILGKNVRNGITQSCGCSKIRNWTNEKIGLLTVLEKTNLRKDGAVIWKCQCECGNIKYVSSNNLRRKDVLSCGCKKISYGENQIRLLLDKHNILYETEKEFESCRFIDSNFCARFDFYVNNTYLIEFDGIQHFQYSVSGMGKVLSKAAKCEDKDEAAQILTDYCNKQQELAFADARHVLNDVRWYMSYNCNTMKNGRNPETDEVYDTLVEIDPLDLSKDKNLNVTAYGR